MLLPLIWTSALSTASADFRPNLWFNLTFPDSSPIIQYLPKSNATFSRWNTSFSDSSTDPDTYVPGALGRGVSTTRVDVSSYEEAVLSAPFTGVWFLGGADDSVQTRLITVDGKGNPNDGTLKFEEPVGSDRVLASTTRHDFGLHEARMIARGTGTMSIQEVMFTTGIMSNASSWDEALASATVVPFVENGQPNERLTLHDNARLRATWNVSTTLGPPEDRMSIDTLHGSRGVTLRMALPPNTTLAILNGTFGPDHTVIWVGFDPVPPFVPWPNAGSESRLSTYNKWTGLGALHLQHLDPSVQYSLVLRPGERSEGQGVHSLICVPGTGDATTTTVDNSNTGTSGNTDVPPASTVTVVPQAPVNHSRTNTGAIVGGVVGGVLGLLLILAGVFLIHRRRNRIKSPTVVHEVDLSDDGPPSEDKGLASLVHPYASPKPNPYASPKANPNVGNGHRKNGNVENGNVGNGHAGYSPTDGSSVSAEPLGPLEPLPDRAYLNNIDGYHNTLLSPAVAMRPSPWETPQRHLPALAVGSPIGSHPSSGEKLLASPEALLYSPHSRTTDSTSQGTSSEGPARLVEHDEDAGLVVPERELLPPMYRSEWAARQRPQTPGS